MQKSMFKSEKQTWETPDEMFSRLNSVFDFNLDACADELNRKCEKYYTETDNSLTKDWVGNVWCNPPYSKFQIDFVKHGYNESLKNDSTVVFLIPARPDTKLWQDFIFKNASLICFVKGRIKFKGAKDSAPFPSALVVFSKNDYDLTDFGYCLKLHSVTL